MQCFFHKRRRLDKAVNLSIMRCTLLLLSQVFLAARVVGNNSTQTPKKAVHPKIMGGDLTAIEQHPYMAEILVNKQHHCGGSIITVQWILSAAHCAQERKKKFRVSVGHTMRAAGQIYDVEEVVSHRNFNQRRKSADIAMFKVKGTYLDSLVRISFRVSPMTISGSFKLSNKIKVLALNYVESHNNEYDDCYTAGWGTTKAADPDRLQDIELFTISLGQCRQSSPFCGPTFAHWPLNIMRHPVLEIQGVHWSVEMPK